MPAHPAPSQPGEWDVACPFCGADAGEPCRTASGRMAARTHADRPLPTGRGLVVAPSTEVALARPASPPAVVPDVDAPTGDAEALPDGPVAADADTVDEQELATSLPRVRLVPAPSPLRADLRELRLDPLRLAGLLATVITLFVSSRVLLG